VKTPLIPMIGLALVLTVGCQKSPSDAADDLAAERAKASDDIAEARDDALDKGIVINGLPIMLRRPSGYWDTEKLDVYYRACVIGGPGAFIIPITERSQFAEAVRTKIVREVAAVDYAIIPAQAAPELDCAAEERRNQQWWRN